jgi:hypothetical protein
MYGWELAAGHIKAYKVAEMRNVRATGTSFTPRYQMEISSSGPLNIRPASSTTRFFTMRSRSSGSIYVIECPYCRKRFSHKTNDASRRKHKQANGWDCPGRRGHLVDTRY